MGAEERKREFYNKYPAFGIRMDELKQRQTLADERSVNAGRKIGPILARHMTRDEYFQVIADIQSPVSLDTDNMWIAALLRSGVPAEKIVEIWDDKDELSREHKQSLAEDP